MLSQLSIHERVSFLKNSLIFSDVESVVLEKIAIEMEVLNVHPGQIIFEKGDAADKMYVIIEGTYKIYDGENVLNVMRNGGIFGEYALIDNNKRTASVMSEAGGRLLTLSAASFYNMLKDNLNITLAIMKSLVFRITSEKDKSEKLLQNILPYEIAEELKLKGRVNVKNIEFATVLFTDFSGFTRISETIKPEDLIEELNYCFTRFDNIISKYGIEKVKTIGDAYMCVGGIPVENKTNPFDVVLAALEIRDFMNKRFEEKKAAGMDYWKCRIGVNTGNVIAGIVGVKKFAYDIWSDTVNTASRMESCGEPGKVNISDSTYKIIGDFFDCSYRGEIEAKGKGAIKMYFVHGLKQEFSKNGQMITPILYKNNILSE
ncbi:MAG: adenylate/guanylate cyclase domain-containing protein [Bacteroidales bacterium]|nr:adenylate/guanylate cyclase domain-containing protein [Bacteroidales bacterium]